MGLQSSLSENRVQVRISPGLRECRGLNERSTRIDWKFTFQASMVRLNIRSYTGG